LLDATGMDAVVETLGGDSVGAIVLLAVGDLALTVDPEGQQPARELAVALAPLREVIGQADIVLGNLECTLPGDGRSVATVPRLVSSPEQLEELRTSGFSVVTLANNHVFDCLDAGFRTTRAALDRAGVRTFGAGGDLGEAAAPLILEIKGQRLAFLGAADRRSTAEDRFAGDAKGGVAPLEIGRLVARVRHLKTEVDHVIVALHWGAEYVRFPAPSQVAAARALAEAGASLVIGSHPHVVQGMEVHRGVPIAYSLGNFVVNDFFYPDGRVTRTTQRPLAQRTGCVLAARLKRGEPVQVARMAVVDTGSEIVPDASGYGTGRLASTDTALARGIGPLRYKLEHARVHVLLPALRSLRWSKLRRLAPARVIDAITGLRASSRAE
jgi:hypothetical protein